MLTPAGRDALQSVHRPGHAVRELERVALRLPRDVDERGRASVAADEAHAIHRPEAHVGDVAHMQATGQHDVGHVFRLVGLLVDDDQDLMVVAVHPADRLDPQGVLNRRGEGVVAEAQRS